MSEIKLPELCRASLFTLYQRAQVAQAEYTNAASHALAALGLDPREDNGLNLDTGVVTPAKKESPAQSGK
jgi:hypothetical protein